MMIDCAKAILVASQPDLEVTCAFVDNAQHIELLQKTYRINGSFERSKSTSSATPRLRLALEEIVVGIARGFLRLEPAAISSGGSSNHKDEGRAYIEKVAQEVAESRGVSGDSRWTLSPQRRDQLRIFLDLWDKGYIVTFGSKFGANFLIYKDSPKRTHAVALIVVKRYEEEFDRVDVVSFCRVAKMVKKNFFFACVRTNEDYETGYEQFGEASEEST
ncbi:trna-intron endonuclease [Plasmopara halstedii]|uniref:tRNA-intron lyase n=1 Tax=Plasmopara halstedii TaxID=4781 RepID=A0A0N7L7E0_PLAHL|nr:trna-intron endonuclease [Plasmopara halstedii]CEG46811.1 trna-intron endonuclease [Plasmopara halstedii]|eukprot:XP_024583180.1 trna-intron endonuclease [Plasmopara halstedii]